MSWIAVYETAPPSLGPHTVLCGARRAILKAGGGHAPTVDGERGMGADLLTEHAASNGALAISRKANKRTG